MSSNSNLAAFARPAFVDVMNHDRSSSQKGLTKHEYFAAAVLSGLASNPNVKPESISTDELAEIALKLTNSFFIKLSKME